MAGNAIYWQTAEDMTAREHARIAHEIVNEFGYRMMQPNTGGFVSTPPALTKAHVHATLALALAAIEGRTQ